MSDPVASSKCDVCGLDYPHGHTEFDVIQQRYARKAFEERYTNVVTSSWDGDTSSISPRRAGPRPEDGYLGYEDNRRWQTYVNAWLDAWKHFSAIQRCVDGSTPIKEGK